ncbi:MAG: double-cubane-cluster-containing anaerobic reductase [bacterium]
MVATNCSNQEASKKDGVCAAQSMSNGPFGRFERMIPNALSVAKEAKEKGKKIAGIFCEYTPRELFFAADILPICMCGGQEETIAEAEKELPANLCPLIKSSYGHALLRGNPFMEMADLLVAETTCDGKKKMYELLGRDRLVHVMELPQKPDEEAAFRHWLEEIKTLKTRLEGLSNIAIDDVALMNASEKMNEERALRRTIAYLAVEDPPLLSGSEILLAKSSISLIPCDLVAYKNIVDWARTRPSPYGGRPRILLTGVPIPHGAEKVMKILEAAGGVVVAQENCTGLKPIINDVNINGDILGSLARHYLEIPCTCMTPNQRRIDLLSRLIEDFRPDGVVELIWQACHTFNVESDLIRREAQVRWKIPYLKLETDYSPSDQAQLTVRVEAFLELCRANKG